MKKLIYSVAFVSIFAACNTKKEEDKRDMLFLTDTTSLNISADTAAVAPVAAAPIVATAPVARRNTNTTRARATRSTNNTTARRSSSGSSASTGTNSTTTAKKQGWSKAAKGAAIGGVA